MFNIEKKDWEKTTIEEIATIKGGKRMPKGRILLETETPHPYIKVKNMHGSKIINLDKDFEFVSENDFEKISNYTVKSGDIIISIVGTIGLVSLVGETLNNANLTENCVKLINIDNFSTEYLYYYLTSEIGQYEIAKGIVGSTQPKLPIYNIKKISIPRPPLKDQKLIANILSSFDDKIETNNAIIANLETQAQAIFKSWFIDFEPFQDGEFVESELGLIPKGWEVMKLEDIVIYNKRGFSPKYDEENVGIPVINQRCIRSNRIIDEAIKYHDENKKKAPKDKFYKPYDVLINSMGVGTLGRVSQVSKLKEERIVHSCITILRVNLDVMKPAIFGQMMIYFEPLFETMGQGSTGQTSLKNKDLDDLEFIVAPIDVQNKVESILEKILNYTDNLYEENQKLAEIRDALLPKLMSGEIRVGQDDIEEIENLL